MGNLLQVCRVRTVILSTLTFLLMVLFYGRSVHVLHHLHDFGGSEWRKANMMLKTCGIHFSMTPHKRDREQGE